METRKFRPIQEYITSMKRLNTSPVDSPTRGACRRLIEYLADESAEEWDERGSDIEVPADGFIPTTAIFYRSMFNNGASRRPMIAGVALPYALNMSDGAMLIRIDHKERAIFMAFRGEVGHTSPITLRHEARGVWEIPDAIIEDLERFDDLVGYLRFAYNEEAFQTTLHHELPLDCHQDARNIAFLEGRRAQYYRSCFFGCFRFNELVPDVWRTIFSILVKTPSQGLKSWIFQMSQGDGCVDRAFRESLFNYAFSTTTPVEWTLCDANHGSCVGLTSLFKRSEVKKAKQCIF